MTEENPESGENNIVKDTMARVFKPSLFRGILRTAGLRKYVKDRRDPGQDPAQTNVAKEIERIFNFERIREINRTLIDIERRWELQGSMTNVLTVADFRDRVIELYSNAGEISSSIGPFTSRSMTRAEGEFAERGTGILEGSHSITVELQDENGNTEEVEGHYSVPDKKELEWPEMVQDENGKAVQRSYAMRLIGSDADALLRKIAEEIDGLCTNVVETRWKMLPKDQQTKESKKIISDNVNMLIGDFAKDKLSFISEGLVEINDEHAKNLTESEENSGEGGHVNSETVIGHYREIDQLMRNISNNVLKDSQVHYQHTYHVLRNVAYKKDEKTGELQKVALGSNAFPFKLRGNERVAGLDEHGWPLEVVPPRNSDEGSPAYRFYLHSIVDGALVSKIVECEPGTVLLDLFEHEEYLMGLRDHDVEVRVVPREYLDLFSEPLDHLEMATLIDVEYDSLRDSLRDGRDHPVSSTALLEIFQNLKNSKFNVRDIENDVNITDEGAYAEIRSHHPNYRDVSFVEPIVPTHLDPAFDLRMLESTDYKNIHWGRKYYYATSTHNAVSPYPTMSTRGIALFIVHYVLENTRSWEEAEEIIEGIGGRIDGYDIGPRMDSWGKNLPTNPFK